ncbi:MAG: AMP-binding protein, partial [Rubripirellula sp.]
MGFLLDGYRSPNSTSHKNDKFNPRFDRRPDTDPQTHRDEFASHGDMRSPLGVESFRNLPAFGLFQHAAEQIPDHCAIVYGERHWTYQRLNRDAKRAAAMLQRLGVRPGDRVGILLPNVPEYIIAANAIWRA